MNKHLSAVKARSGFLCFRMGTAITIFCYMRIVSFLQRTSPPEHRACSIYSRVR